ncbi:hypothetical protein J6590_017071 [Homalodisca vitripennis]|nr:hypothetical protein J6590_017071 [Homalodisca vitripennis]
MQIASGPIWPSKSSPRPQPDPLLLKRPVTHYLGTEKFSIDRGPKITLGVKRRGCYNLLQSTNVPGGEGQLISQSGTGIKSAGQINAGGQLELLAVMIRTGDDAPEKLGHDNRLVEWCPYFFPHFGTQSISLRW